MEAMKTGPRGGEPFGHLEDDPAKCSQHVEAELDGFEASVVAGSAEQGEEIEDASGESLGRGGEGGLLLELSQNRLSISDVVGIDRWVREDPLEEPAVHGDGDALNLEKEYGSDQSAEEKVVGEVGGIPVTDTHLEIVEDGISFSGAGATEESEIEQIEKAGPIGALCDRRVEQIGQWEIRELSPPNQIRAARCSRQELANRRRQSGFGAVKPVIVFVSHPTTGIPSHPSSQQSTAKSHVKKSYTNVDHTARFEPIRVRASDSSTLCDAATKDEVPSLSSNLDRSDPRGLKL